jgi:hypothetical protein
MYRERFSIFYCAVEAKGYARVQMLMLTDPDGSRSRAG